MRRTGATLTEVLIAIFVMGIGVISLLVLFPVGIHNMAASMQDNRLAIAAGNAAALAEFRSVRNDPAVVGNPITPPAGSMYGFILNNQPGLNFLLTPVYQGPSPPVYIDPIGYDIWGPQPVGALAPSLGIPRATVSFALPGTGQAQQLFIMNDDIHFDMNGQAYINPALAPPLVERDHIYSWAYMWRRPRFSEPSVAEMSVVVYSGRKLQPNAIASAVGELPFVGPTVAGILQPVFDPVNRPTTAILTWPVALGPSGGPPVKRGTWILDATVMPLPPPGYIPPVGYPAPYFNGYFYKVVDAAEPQLVGVEWQRRVELATPVRNVGFVAVIMSNVADVIELNDGRTP